jgi:hypothetical protein
MRRTMVALAAALALAGCERVAKEVADQGTKAVTEDGSHAAADKAAPAEARRRQEARRKEEEARRDMEHAKEMKDAAELGSEWNEAGGSKPAGQP